MFKDDYSLLELERTPTIEELKEQFHKNDFSAAAADIDYASMPNQTAEALAFIRRFMDEKWESQAQEMGLQHSKNYSKRHPLIAMRNSLEKLAAAIVWYMMSERPEVAISILMQYDFSDPNIHKYADDFLHNAVHMTMEVLDFPTLVQVMKEFPIHEDFAHGKARSFSEIDFFRKWNHSRSKIEVTSLDDLEETAQASSVNVEDYTIEKLKTRAFWSSLSDEDRELIKLKMEGRTTQEIAGRFGLKTPSAIVKRLKKLRKRYDSV